MVRPLQHVTWLSVSYSTTEYSPTYIYLDSGFANAIQVAALTLTSQRRIIERFVSSRILLRKLLHFCHCPVLISSVDCVKGSHLTYFETSDLCHKEQTPEDHIV